MAARDRESIISRFLTNLAKACAASAGTAAGVAVGGAAGGPIGAVLGALGGALIDGFIARFRQKPDVQAKLTAIRERHAANDLKSLQEMLIEAAGVVDDRTDLERLDAVVDNPEQAPNEPLLREAIQRLFNRTGLATDDPEAFGALILRNENITNHVKAQHGGFAAGMIQNFGEMKIVLSADGTPRDGSAVNPDELALRVSTSKLPAVGEHFLGRDERMAELDTAWADGKLKVLSLVADGGVGKTSLLHHWLMQFARDGFRGAERVFAWSFYSQGTTDTASAEPFINEALEWFGDPNPQAGSPWNRGVRLAELVRKHRTLLILDGFEPMQHPEEQLDGRVREQSFQALITELAAQNPGLLLITTRLKVADLDPFQEKTTHRIDLEMLSPAACVELFKRLGVKGTDDEMKEAAAHFNHHALSIQLLGNYIAKRYDDHDIHHWKEVSLLDADEWDRNHATKVMKSYERWFVDENHRAELAYLFIIGLFNRPASAAELSALLNEPAIAGLTDAIIELSENKRLLALKRLREAGLLLPKDDRNPGALDAHPLVREHFGERLRAMNEAAYKAGHSRLFDYLTGPGCEKVHPDTLEEMAPLYAAIPHGCKAGRQQEALHHVFARRIRRGNEGYSLHKLGAFGSDLAALASFFEEPWSRPASVFDQRRQAWLLSEAAFCLRASGRFGEAVEPFRAALHADRSLAEPATEAREYHWHNAAIGAGNLSELLLALGRTEEAIEWANLSVDHADHSGDAGQKMISRTTLADALHQAGRVDEARRYFEQTEEMQKEDQPEFPLLYSLRGFQYCDLLLDAAERADEPARVRSRAADVRQRAAQSMKIAVRNNWLLSIALDHLTLGRAMLIECLHGGEVTIVEAAARIDTAVDKLREAGTIHHIPRGLLVRAARYRAAVKHGDPSSIADAERDLDEVIDIATRDAAPDPERDGTLKLFLCDARLEYARLRLAQTPPDVDAAREHAEKAAALIAECGYHRRDREVDALRARLGA